MYTIKSLFFNFIEKKEKNIYNKSILLKIVFLNAIIYPCFQIKNNYNNT